METYTLTQEQYDYFDEMRGNSDRDDCTMEQLIDDFINMQEPLHFKIFTLIDEVRVLKEQVKTLKENP